MDKDKTEKQVYEAKGMALMIFDGYSKDETAEAFDVSKRTVERRLKMIGRTYRELVEIREKRKKKQGS